MDIRSLWNTLIANGIFPEGCADRNTGRVRYIVNDRHWTETFEKEEKPVCTIDDFVENLAWVDRHVFDFRQNSKFKTELPANGGIFLLTGVSCKA